MSKRGRRGGPTVEAISAVEQAIAAGLPESVAAVAAGIPYGTVREWMAAARAGRGGLYAELSAAIQRARAKAEAIAIGQVRRAGADDWRAASWWLTHHPATRDRWSDAGAVRTAEANLLAKVVSVLQAEVPDLQQRHRLLTALVAAGCGPMPEGGEDAAGS